MARAMDGSSLLVHPEPPALAPARPVYSFNDYLRRRFARKVYKVTLDAGFTCPNRDGSQGWGGCTFCNNEGFSVYSGRDRLPLIDQFRNGAAYVRARFKAEAFIAYFQAYTNTYSDVDRLKAVYDTVAFEPDVVGLAIGTRPDCVSDEILDLVSSYAATEREVWIEYGLQTAHDETLGRVNRGHGVAAFQSAMERTAGRPLKVCVHLIVGLPGEDHRTMMETAEYLGRFRYHGLKLHVLHVLARTAMERDYREGRLRVLEMDEYVGLACDMLERIAPDVVVHRLSADAPWHVLVAPAWCLEKARTRVRILSEFQRRGTNQGARHAGVGPHGRVAGAISAS